MLSSKKVTNRQEDALGSAMTADVWAKYPMRMEEQGFDVYHLGPKDAALFLCELRDPITLTAVSTPYRYNLPFDMTLHKFVWYQQDAAGDEADDAINIRFDLLHPNRTPENVYNKTGAVWGTGGSRNTGRTTLPAGGCVLTVDGTATNLLYFSMEIEVWKRV